MPKIASLHGTKPVELFQWGIERHEEIEAVAICVMMNDGSVRSGWSSIAPPGLALMVLALDENQRKWWREDDQTV